MRKCRLSLETQQKLICQFIDGVSVRDAAAITKVNKNTANLYFSRLRELIYANDSSPGIAEIDSVDLNFMYTQVIKCSKYFNKGRTFCLAMRDGKVRVLLFPDQLPFLEAGNASHGTNPDHLVYQGAKGEAQCASLGDEGDGGKVVRFKDCQARSCAMKRVHGMNNFCELFSLVNRRCCGIPRQHFHLYLKEIEWKFNNPDRSWQTNQLTRWAVDEMG